ncbi:MAG TPA: ATP-binding protein [Gemmatimonas sp.]|nr:ATP-binding protein [Gemmatimonas sp.]
MSQTFHDDGFSRRAASLTPPADTAELRRRLEEAESTLHAIRTGQVDAFVIDRGLGDRLYTLESADRPYRLLVESMREGAMVLGTEGQLLFINASLAGMLRAPRSSLLGEPLARYVAPADRPTLDGMLTQAVAGNVHRDITFMREDGSVLPVHLSMNAGLSDMPGICAIVVDLTERRRHEEMSRAQALLKEADRRKDEFLATLAHELRNPLAPVRNAVQLLRMLDPSHPDVRRAYDIIDRQISQMSRLVDDLLDLSRITRGQIALQRRQVDLATVMRAALETSEPAISSGRHTVTVSLPDIPVMLNGDLTRLAQVFSNLLNNAAKYTDAGGRIEVTAVQRDAVVDVCITDNGIGIASEILPQVFDMFTQAGPTSSRSRNGLGIGLALVKRLLDLHGGTVIAHSDGIGKGSQFCVTLPAMTNVTPRAHTPRAEQAVPDAAALRVMVVDDNEDSAVTLGLLLERYGCITCVVHTGLAALQEGAIFRPDVILLDLGMPDVDGFETCRRLRHESWGATVRVVALTGWGQAEDRRRTKAGGFDHHMVKPVQSNMLMSVLTGKGRDAGDRRAR